MKRYYTLYYLLFMIMITGAFASVAQNNYGMKLIGIACLGFAFLFLFEAAFDYKRRSELKKSEKFLSIVELVLLGSIALLLFFRSFFITLENASALLTSLLILLSSLYFLYLFGYLQKWWQKSKPLATGLLFYFLVLILCLVAVVIIPGAGYNNFILESLILICLLVFVVWIVVHNRLMIDGENTSIIAQIWRMRNKSAILFFACLMVGLFFVLHRSHIIPGLYTSEKPAGYLQLARDKEDKTKNSDEHSNEIFDQRYSEFVKKYGR